MKIIGKITCCKMPQHLPDTKIFVLNNYSVNSKDVQTQFLNKKLRQHANGSKVKRKKSNISQQRHFSNFGEISSDDRNQSTSSQPKHFRCTYIKLREQRILFQIHVIRPLCCSEWVSQRLQICLCYGPDFFTIFTLFALHIAKV